MRFSSDAQSDGNSFARQRSLAQAYLDKNMPADIEVEWIEDPATSAFNGENLESGALGKLLNRVREKTVTDGLLIFEAVDRASRQGGMSLMAMLNELLDAGLSLCFLDLYDQRPFDKHEKPDMLGTYLSLKADLARLESMRKSRFSKDNWRRKRDLARKSKVPFTAECPMWLSVEGDVYKPQMELVDSIRKVFELAQMGWGISRIVRYANGETWPAPAKGTKWHLSLVRRLFENRALIGEFQPYRGRRKNRQVDGDPIQDFYPVVVEPSTFYAVSAIRKKASPFPNRRDVNNYNYLLGLGKCECGGTWRRLNKNSGKQLGYAQYSCSNRQLGVTRCANLPARKFDMQFIGIACEKIPELLKVVDGTLEAKKTVIQGKLENVGARISRWLDLYDAAGTNIADILPRLEAAQTERDQLVSQLDELEKSAPPPGDFDFGDAISAYLPAFLNVYHDELAEESKLAFDARALFRTRILASVESVQVAQSRKNMVVRLRNGISFTEPLEDDEDGFTDTSDFSDGELHDQKAQTLRAMNKLLPR
ncbi:recombinase family protein [uncultured Herbaspirillum sp.]